MDYYQSPYFDDFRREGDDGLTPQEKNFLRVLYRPGFAVQARELNTTQSILLNQISLLVSAIWPDGDLIKGTRTDVYTIRPTGSILLEWSNSEWLIDGSDSELVKEEKRKSVLKYLNDYTNNLQADGSPVSTLPDIDFVEVTETDNEYRLFFDDNSSLTVSDDILSGTIDYLDPIDNTLLIAASDKIGSVAAVNKSITYQLGSADSIYATGGLLISTASVAHRTLRAVAPDSPFAVDVVFRPVTSVITSASDKSLLDNAAGSANWNADGAHRESIRFELVLTDDKEPADIVLESLTESSTSGSLPFTQPGTIV